MTEAGRKRVLLAEDDERLATMMRDYLQKYGYEATIEPNGGKVVDRVAADPPDALVLDVMLPNEDGFSICRRVRRFYAGPILVLTARDEEFDEVAALELGADDFVTKPASLRVVLARLEALLRRSDRAPDSRVRLGDLAVDAVNRVVTVGGAPVDLTTAEFELLWILVQGAGRVLSRQELMRKTRGIDYDGLDRSIDVRIVRLRQKLGDDPAAPTRIKTVRGVGYLMARSEP